MIVNIIWMMGIENILECMMEQTTTFTMLLV